MSVSVISYGLGNLGSVLNMLKRIGVETHIVESADAIAGSERVLLPGVGAFDRGMTLLREGDFDTALRDFVRSGRTVMGICLGMQLLLDGSDEGVEPGLGLIPGRSKRFDDSVNLRVPHMGWNHIQPLRTDPLLEGLDNQSRFYFVHSYHVVPESADHTLATTAYGGQFTSMIRSKNVMGVQFHPEKSHAYGMTLLRNFAKL